MGIESTVMIHFLTASTAHLRASLVRHGHAVGRTELSAFADRERRYRLKGEVAGLPVAICASVLPGPESLFDLLALNRLLRENGAAEVALIVPYLGYARQDRPAGRGEASIGIMVAELVRSLKPSRLIVCDVHSERIRTALGPSAVELSALPLFAAALTKRPPEVIVSPDAGSVGRARRLAELLASNPAVAWVDKVRPRPNVACARRLHGAVQGKDVLIVDDMIDTGGTLVEAVKLVGEQGAAGVRIAATHGIFSRDACERLATLPVREILITDTLPQSRRPKVRRLDVVPLLAAGLVG
ncbi:MAG: ribose-phosphate diphosphokinase [Syntrophales bacterium]